MNNFNNIFSHEKRNDVREGDFNKRNKGRNKFGGRDDRNRKGRMEMFEATCSACGKRCEVPFRPTGDKPVYCSDCFSKQGGGNNNRFQRGGGFDRPRFQEKAMFDAVCNKCGKRFSLPFRPTGEKPVYCRDCFDKGGNKSVVTNTNQYKEQFNALNAKLDAILKILTPAEKKKETVMDTKRKSSPAKKAGKKTSRKKKN